jgi:phosphoribosylformimino-5-aminoimidazole carboxamide ribotide isomerase
VLIVPAIDLRGGRCVRLIHGDPGRETRYDGDPVERARDFVRAGARRIHVIDLDGALGTGENIAAFRAVCSAAGVPVQTGGGIRTFEDARDRFDAGASFVVLGTLLAEQTHMARAIVDVYGDRIIAGLDTRGDTVMIHGWKEGAPLPRDEFVREIAAWGIPRIVHTEIARDGTGEGYDIAALAHVAALAPLRITASGGAKTLADLRALVAGTPPNVDSAIVGRALYEGTIDLAEAIAATAAAV